MSAAVEKVKAMVKRVRPGQWQEGWWGRCELLGITRHRSSPPYCRWDKTQRGTGNRNAKFPKGGKESLACLA